MSGKRRDPGKSRRGMVLVTCLWVLMLLSFLALSVVYRVRLSCAVTDYQSDEMTAGSLLDAGLARALWAVRQDQDAEVDWAGETWGMSRTMREEGLIPAEYLYREEPVIRWKVEDVGRKLNVNTIRADLLASVLGAYYQRNIETDLLADSITDWLDSDGEGFAEADFYVLGGYPYTPRDDVIPYVEELLAVRDVPPWLFLGEDWNGNGILDESENDGVRRYPEDNADGELQAGLQDLFTVTGDGILNVNTAPLDLLNAVFRTFVEPGKATSLVAELAQAQAGVDGLPGTPDDRPFRSTQEIADIIGVKLYTQCRNAGVPLGVNAPAFEIHVFVELEAERIKCRGTGLVIRGDDGPQLAYWRPES